MPASTASICLGLLQTPHRSLFGFYSTARRSLGRDTFNCREILIYCEKEELSSQLTKEEWWESSCAWVGPRPRSRDRGDRLDCREATPHAVPRFRTCLLCTNVLRACVLTQVGRVNHDYSDGDAADVRKAGRKNGREGIGAAADSSFPIAIYDLWTLFGFAAETTPTIALSDAAAQAHSRVSSRRPIMPCSLVCSP